MQRILRPEARLNQPMRAEQTDQTLKDLASNAPGAEWVEGIHIKGIRVSLHVRPRGRETERSNRRARHVPTPLGLAVWGG